MTRESKRRVSQRPNWLLLLLQSWENKYELLNWANTICDGLGKARICRNVGGEARRLFALGICLTIKACRWEPSVQKLCNPQSAPERFSVNSPGAATTIVCGVLYLPV